MGKLTSYRELLIKIDCAAAAFLNSGILKGDRIAVCLPNSPQAVICLYSLNRIGAVAVMLNPLYSSEMLINEVKEANCKGLVVLDLILYKFRESSSLPKMKLMIHTGLIGEMPAKVSLNYILTAFPRILRSAFDKANTNFQSWNNFISSAPIDLPPAQQDPYKDAVIMFSGGTSGNPKPVVHSSESINTSSVQCLTTEPPIEDGMSMLAILPIFHMFGLNISIHLPLLAGGKCILIPRFNASRVAQVLINKKPTYMAGVPTIYEGIFNSRVLQKAQVSNDLDFSKFRIGFCGGDKLPQKSLDTINNIIISNKGTGRIVEGYGLTESCPITVMPRDGTGSIGSLGRPFPSIEICIVQPGTKEIVVSGQEGEICISAKSIMTCYLNDLTQTTKALLVHNDGKRWLHTGDIGKIDEYGYLFFHHRLRRIIKVSGYSVFCSHVEEVLLTHPGVHMACIIGTPDNYSIHRVKAFIVLNSGYKKNNIKKELLNLCRQKLSPWSTPSVWEFRSNLPKNLLGKICWGSLEKEAKM